MRQVHRERRWKPRVRGGHVKLFPVSRHIAMENKLMVAKGAGGRDMGIKYVLKIFVKNIKIDHYLL